MLAADRAKVGLGNPAGREKGAIDYGAAHVQRAAIALRKWASSQPDGCKGSSLIIERAKIFRKPANFLELSR